jgi:F-type H+-transporting ATPase subunit alpha
MKQVAGRIKGELAQFRELAAFAQFGSDLDARTVSQLERGKRIVEVFKQPQYNPIDIQLQVAILWAVQNGAMDDVAADRIREFQVKLADFLGTRKTELLNQIAREKALTDEMTTALKAAVTEFKSTWR